LSASFCVQVLLLYFDDFLLDGIHDQLSMVTQPNFCIVLLRLDNLDFVCSMKDWFAFMTLSFLAR
jgi:hypothetical protein